PRVQWTIAGGTIRGHRDWHGRGGCPRPPGVGRQSDAVAAKVHRGSLRERPALSVDLGGTRGEDHHRSGGWEGGAQVPGRVAVTGSARGDKRLACQPLARFARQTSETLVATVKREGGLRPGRRLNPPSCVNGRGTGASATGRSEQAGG